MAQRAQSQIRALAAAVARSFAMADLTQEERYPQQILHTRLPWSTPALMPASATLGGEDLSNYLDYPIKVEAQALHAFWVRTLNDMWFKPHGTLHSGSYAGLGQLLRTTKVGMRALRFAQPPGYPGQFEMQAGVQLSLEVAHLAYLSLPCKRRMNLDDYVVTLADGTEFGVRAGRPIVNSMWDSHDASGDVFDMLEQPRGPVSYVCQYDQIAQLRSVVHTHPDAFREDYQGLDTALQALRFLSWGSSCPDLSTSMQTEPTNLPLLRHKARLIEDCLNVMASDRLNDRQKLETLKGTLVPDVLSASGFKLAIFSSGNFPFTMLRGRAEAIVGWLENYYETEIPCNLRRSL